MATVVLHAKMVIMTVRKQPAKAYVEISVQPPYQFGIVGGQRVLELDVFPNDVIEVKVIRDRQVAEQLLIAVASDYSLEAIVKATSLDVQLSVEKTFDER